MVAIIKKSELNSINTTEVLKTFEKERESGCLDECIIEINKILIRSWHLIIGNTDILHIEYGFNHGYAAFNKAKELFLKEDIYLSYYQPHGMLLIKYNESV